ncbi:MAG: hypothetical protein EOO61_01460 [Hymenobacter sp.]|nr:MAG: hypothetical protein EOO61_01460 [Hymenobacter sp.]
MTYDEKYDSMPLRGKTTFYGWLRHHNRKGWMDESRRYGRKHHRHYDLYKDWWSKPIYSKWEWRGVSPSKGHKRKTWKDYY